MHTVRRLEGLREIVGQQMASTLKQHNLLHHLEKKGQVWHWSTLWFFVFLDYLHQGQFFVCFLRGITTASLNHWGTDPDSSESFTVLQIKGIEAFKYFLSVKWSEWDQVHNFWGRTCKSFANKLLRYWLKATMLAASKRVWCVCINNRLWGQNE